VKESFKCPVAASRTTERINKRTRAYVIQYSTVFLRSSYIRRRDYALNWQSTIFVASPLSRMWRSSCCDCKRYILQITGGHFVFKYIMRVMLISIKCISLIRNSPLLLDLTNKKNAAINCHDCCVQNYKWHKWQIYTSLRNSFTNANCSIFRIHSIILF